MLSIGVSDHCMWYCHLF